MAARCFAVGEYTAIDQPALLGCLLVAGTKGADFVTTVIGLSITGVVETNPLVLRAIGTYGLLPGLALIGALSVAIAVVVTEGAVAFLRRITAASARAPLRVRVVGYGLPAVVNLFVAGHNVALLLAV